MSQSDGAFQAAAANLPQQSAWFSAEYESVRKDEVVGALLAFFLGTFGAHHFYLGQNRLGILYAVFFWTGIPTVCGFVECFLMPGRVRAFNFAYANAVAARLSGAPAAPMAVGDPQAPNTCGSCGHSMDRAAIFCTRCGASTASPNTQTVPATAR